ncbi:MAG: hypothetical protein NXI22_11945 [bacterium]|nr:hypothetical protein [bacterium]
MLSESEKLADAKLAARQRVTQQKLPETFPPEEKVLELPAERVPQLWDAIVAGVEGYGFEVVRRELEDPKTGIFNGLVITVDPGSDLESQCFILLHLFGHSVQWVAPSLSEISERVQHTSDRDEFMKVLYEYEQGAAELGLQLLHEIGVTDLDQWLSDYADADWRYVELFYNTGELQDFETLLLPNRPLFSPRPIPPLEHRKVKVRFSF